MSLQKGLEVDPHFQPQMFFDFFLAIVSLFIICQLIAALVISTQGHQAGRIAFREKIEQIEEDMEEVGGCGGRVVVELIPYSLFFPSPPTPPPPAPSL